MTADYSNDVSGPPAGFLSPGQQINMLTAGIWRISDLKISLASIAFMYLGACYALDAGDISWFWLLIVVIGILSIEAAKNASGEVFDCASDSAVATQDKSPFSGGKRVIVDGLLTRRQTLRGSTHAKRIRPWYRRNCLTNCPGAGWRGMERR